MLLQGRRKALPLLALAALLAGIPLAGCGSSDGKTTTSTAANARAPHGQFLTVVQAADGTLRPHGDGFVLTLRGVAPQVAAFSDRPERQAGALSSSAYFDTWAKDYRGDPPNAALALINGAANADTVVLTLEPPRSRGQNVTFNARPLTSTPGNLEQFRAETDPSVPQRFDAASLFVDAGGLMQLVAYGAQDVYVTGGG